MGTYLPGPPVVIALGRKSSRCDSHSREEEVLDVITMCNVFFFLFSPVRMLEEFQE